VRILRTIPDGRAKDGAQNAHPANRSGTGASLLHWLRHHRRANHRWRGGSLSGWRPRLVARHRFLFPAFIGWVSLVGEDAHE
jgi:hypothetical protein